MIKTVHLMQRNQSMFYFCFIGNNCSIFRNVCVEFFYPPSVVILLTTISSTRIQRSQKVCGTDYRCIFRNYSYGTHFDINLIVFFQHLILGKIIESAFHYQGAYHFFWSFCVIANLFM